MRAARITVLAVVFALAATLTVSAEPPTTLPAGNPPTWSRSYRVHGSDSAVRLLRSREGWRIVGWSGWREGDKPNDWHESWWVLDVNTEGERRALFEFPSRSNFTQVWDAGLVGGEVVVLGGGLTGTMSRVNADGKLISDVKLNDGGPVLAKGLTVTKDSLLVGGSVYRKGESAQDAWIGRFDQKGEKRWSRRFDRGHDETAWDVVALPDGGCVLAINSGNYGKFGQGPSCVWLVWCDAEGKQMRDVVLDPGCLRIGRGHLVECFGGVALSYTTTDFPGIRPGARELGFNTFVAFFDAQLKQNWTVECAPAMLGSGMLRTDSDGHLLVVSPLSRRIVLTRLDDKGQVLGTNVAGLAEGLSVLDVAVDHGAVYVLGEQTLREKKTGPDGKPHYDREIVLMGPLNNP